MMYVVYHIQSKTSGKAYYGSTTNFKRRTNQHTYLLHRNMHHSMHLQNAWNTYGQDDFLIEIIKIFENQEDMLSFEKSLLSDDLRKTYNVSTEVNKQHRLNRPHSAETKAKLSVLFKGRTVTEETKEKIRQARKLQSSPMIGRSHSEETKQKIRLARAKQPSPSKGMKYTEKQKQRMSLAKLGKEYPRIKVITPDGEFVGVKCAAQHYGLTTAAVRYRVKHNSFGWSHANL